MQPAARGLRGAVRDEETPDDEAVATLAAMFPHVPASALRRTLAIGGSADGAATLLLENDWRSFEPQHPRFTAARSVHLDFHFGPGGGAPAAFYNECIVEQHAAGSYFMAIGFADGYFGVQDHGDHRRVLFSVWDANEGETAAVADRAAVLYENAHVVVKRFGGEGTGLQCIDYGADWMAGRRLRFCVMMRRCDDGGACYGAWIWPDGEDAWTHLASFKVARPKDGTLGPKLNSFVEDFRRDGRSVYHERRARFGPAWAWSEAGGWRPAASVTFAATPNGTHGEGGAVDAGAAAAPGTAYLATGGSADPGIGEQRLNLGRPLATLAPGSDGPPPALPADPTTVFTTACPISPPKTPFARSRIRQ